LSFSPPPQFSKIAVFCPVFFLLFPYLAGLITGLYWHPSVPIVLGIVFSLLCFGVYFLTKNRKNLPTLFFSLGIFLVGNLFINHSLCLEFPTHHIYHWANNHRLNIEGVIYRPPELKPDKTLLYVKTQGVWIKGKKFPTTGNLLLFVREDKKIFLLNDRIIFAARLRRPQNFSGSREFNYVRWLAFQDIYVVGHLYKARDLVRIGTKKTLLPLRKIDLFRNNIRETIDRSTPPPFNFLLRALILGEKKNIPEPIRENFNRSGTAHILAISGLHIGIVAVFSCFLLKKFFSLSEFLLLMGNVPKLAASFSLLPIFFYVLVARAGVSVQRAFIMVAAYILSFLLNRGRDAYNALALAAFLILAIQPPSLFGPSFQLSFVSVLGILFFSPRILSLLPKKEGPFQNIANKSGRGIKDKVILLVVVSFSATLATAPLVAYYFNRVSFSGLLANIVVVPLTGFFIVPLGLLGAILTPLSSSVAGFFFNLAAALLNIVIMVTSFFANLPGTSFLVPSPTKNTVLLFYLVLVLLFGSRFFRSR